MRWLRVTLAPCSSLDAQCSTGLYRGSCLTGVGGASFVASQESWVERRGQPWKSPECNIECGVMRKHLKVSDGPSGQWNDLNLGFQPLFCQCLSGPHLFFASCCRDDSGRNRKHQVETASCAGKWRQGRLVPGLQTCLGCEAECHCLGRRHRGTATSLTSISPGEVGGGLRGGML